MIDIESEILNKVIECKTFHRHAPEFGERAWVAEGKEIDVVYWDEGNGWCRIMQIIPKNCKECKMVGIKFYIRLRKILEEELCEELE